MFSGEGPGAPADTCGNISDSYGGFGGAGDDGGANDPGDAGDPWCLLYGMKIIAVNSSHHTL